MTTALIQNQQWQTLFLRVLRNTGTVRSAAEQIGLTAKEVRTFMRANPAFAEEVADAQLDLQELIEAGAIRDALAGDNLMRIFMLKAMAPERYRDNYRKDQDDRNINIHLKTYVGFSPDEWDKQVNHPAQVIDGTATRVIEQNGGVNPDLPISATGMADTTPVGHIAGHLTDR
jgi:hypothetical protein